MTLPLLPSTSQWTNKEHSTLPLPLPGFRLRLRLASSLLLMFDFDHGSVTAIAPKQLEKFLASIMLGCHAQVSLIHLP